MFKDNVTDGDISLKEHGRGVTRGTTGSRRQYARRVCIHCRSFVTDSK